MANSHIGWQGWVVSVQQRLESACRDTEPDSAARLKAEAQVATELRCALREIRRASRLARLLDQRIPELTACPSLQAAAAWLNDREGAWLAARTLRRSAAGKVWETSGTPSHVFDWPPCASVELYQSDGIEWLERREHSPIDCVYTRAPHAPRPPPPTAQAGLDAVKQGPRPLQRPS